MASTTRIEWTDATWNPVTGCTKVSPGCAHCYAEAITLRFRRGGRFLPGETTICTHPERLDDPGKWRSPRMVFVNSMSDLFHESVSFDFVRQVFERMESNPRHTYQVLTKRPERMLEYVSWANGAGWPDHVWAGVSVENQYWADRRIPTLARIPARTRFLSVEPLLGAIEVREHLDTVHWVIVGGESGLKARPVDPEWVRGIRDECHRRSVPFFFKQWGGKTHRSGGRTLDGRCWDEVPQVGIPAHR